MIVFVFNANCGNENVPTAEENKESVYPKPQRGRDIRFLYVMFSLLF